MSLSSILVKIFSPKIYKTHEDLETLVLTRSNTGGLAKRIDENREIYEFLENNAATLLKEHPYLKGWLEGNDNFFIGLAKITELPASHTKKYYRKKKISDMD